MLKETVTSAYPVAASRGQRRRRLLSMMISEEFEQQLLSNDADPLDNVPVDAELTTSPLDQAGTIPRNRSIDDGTRIQELLDDVLPLTWVFTGDCLDFDVRQARRGWIEHFSDFVRERLNRTHDIVLNSTVANSKIGELRRDLDWRILRFQPDVVIIMPGLAECATVGHREEFRATLQEIVEDLHNEGCMVVLSTPPCPVIIDEPVSASLRTAVSRIRSVAAQCDAVLSDNFSHWRAALEQNGSDAALHDDAGQQPSARGHRQLARRLLKSLNVRSS